MSGRTPRRSGMVLVIVLVVVVVLALSCYTFSQLMVTHRDAARVNGLQLQTRALVDSGADSVRIDARDTFSLSELTERFGRGPVPAKFALAEIGGLAVCFDLEAAARDPGGA